MISGRRITINDFVDQGVCASGVRRWCHENNIDFRAFVRNGATEEEAQKYLPNAHLERAIELMKKRTGG